MAESLAVRYRPRRFADVAGQQHVTAVLRSAASREIPPQQILLAGPSGLGKTTTARIFAAALLCEHSSNGDACGLCDTCCEITGATTGHPDVIELDAASNGGKDEIRVLAERAVLGPMRGDWKVYIVDEAHGLTGPGGQAFLRLLEEPPPHCVFILATTDPGKLPTALRGRCLNLEVLPPTAQEARKNLYRIAEGEDWDLPDDVADAVIAASDPALGMRGTVMTLDKISGYLDAGRELSPTDLADILGVIDPARLNELTAAIASGQRAQALVALADLEGRTGRAQLRRQVTAWARDQLNMAARAGTGVDEAFFRFATFAEAPAYDGAFTVAVARAASPHLAESPDAVRALLERAEGQLAALAALPAASALPAPRAPEPAVTPSPPPGPGPAPQAADDTPAEAPAPELSAQVSEPRRDAAEDAFDQAPAPGQMEALTVNDPTVIAVLNAASKVSGMAAFTLRRCSFFRSKDIVYVQIPPAQAVKAAASDVVSVVESVRSGGHPVYLMQ